MCIRDRFDVVVAEGNILLSVQHFKHCRCRIAAEAVSYTHLDVYKRQVDTIVQDFGYRLQMQGMGLEQYLKMTGTEMGAFRAMFKDQAERQVKTRLALQKVVELEGITVSDKELEEEYAKMAEQYLSLIHISDSRDSRLGMVDERYILGHVQSVVFPISDFGTVK